MVENKRPTRAEVTDVANAIYDGTDAVMLSEETTIGKYPVEAVKVMTRIAHQAETHWLPRTVQAVASHGLTIPEAVSHSAAEMSEEMKVKAIVTPTRSGLTARLISRFKPRVPILAITPRPETAKRLALVWGVQAHHLPNLEKKPDLLATACSCAREILGLKKGDLIIITAGLPIQTPPTTNVVQIKEVT
jgi:pyruvate kinase